MAASNTNDTPNKNIVEKKQFPRPYFDNTVDYKYICIKKDFFDVNMVYLNYTSLKVRKCIEIIYKSPSIFLDGLFFKTPKIKASQIFIIKKKHQPFNINLKILLDPIENAEFITMLKAIDNHISNYILRCSKEITRELNEIPEQKGNCIEMFRYDNLLKQYGVHGNRGNQGNQYETQYELHMKSYLDNHILDEITKAKDSYSYNHNGGEYLDSEFVFTFNISNIYLGQVNLIPLVKCNRGIKV